jgi:hypothetical protein
VRRVVDEAAADVADEEVDDDGRQHPRAEGALEPLGQFVAELEAEDEEDADEPEERARRAGRGHVRGLEEEAPERALLRQVWAQREVAGRHPGHARHDPEDDEARRPVELLHVRAEHEEAVHVREQVQRPEAREVDVEEDGRDEAPPLPFVVDEVVELGAVGQQHVADGPARERHQEVEEDVGDEEDEGEGGGTADDGAEEVDGLAVARARAGGGGRGLPGGRAADAAVLLARADERAALPAHARPPGVRAPVSWLTFRQDF